MIAIRFIAGGLMALLGCFLVATNLWIMVCAIRGKQAPSPVPIFGGLIGGLGVAILPIHHALALAAIPILLDWGGSLGLLTLVVQFLRRR